MRMQKTIITALSAAASLMLLAGTLAPVAYGAASSGSSAASKCTLRATLTNDEVAKLAPKDEAYPSATIGDNTDLAMAGSTLGESGSGALYVTNNWGILCSYGVIKQITNILFLVVSILAVAMIVFAAFLYLSGKGDPTKVKEAHQALMFAVVGILVATAAKLIPAIALGLIGVH